MSLTYNGWVTVYGRFEWDEEKNAQNQRKHGLSFAEASRLFDSEYLEKYDEEYSEFEDRFIAVGPVERGIIVVVWTERTKEVIRIISAPSNQAGKTALSGDDMKELTKKDFARMMKSTQRRRLMRGEFRDGDVAALRKFIGLTQQEFATAMGISLGTLQGWEQGRRTPTGPAIALLRIAARYPRILKQNLKEETAA